MKLDGHNTFTGGLTIASGRLQFAGSEIGTANPNGAGTGTITILPGGQLFPSGAAGAGVQIANPMSIAGFGVASELDGAMRLSNNTLTGTITLVGDAELGSGGANNVFVNGQITGNFSLFLGASQTISGTISLGNTSANLNNWTGNTVLQMRTNGNGNNGLTLGADEQIPNGVGFGNVIMVGESTSGGTSTYVWNMNGHNETINGLATGGGTALGTSITNNGAAPSTLTLGDNNQTASFGGIISDGSSTIALTKIGTGLQTLGGVNTYSGDTNVNNGTLSITGSLNQSGNVKLNTSATAGSALFGGNGTGTPSVIGALTLQAANGTHKAVINPGATGPGTTGIINVTSLTVGAGSDLQFDLFSTPMLGSITIRLRPTVRWRSMALRPLRPSHSVLACIQLLRALRQERPRQCLERCPRSCRGSRG